MKKALKNKEKKLKLTTLGFTLIELLAVIIVLAIIALIAVPMVMNIIEESKDSAVERSVQSIQDGAETFIVSKLITDEDYIFDINDYEFDGNQYGKGTDDSRINIGFNNNRQASVAIYENNKCYYNISRF